MMSQSGCEFTALVESSSISTNVLFMQSDELVAVKRKEWILARTEFIEDRIIGTLSSIVCQYNGGLLGSNGLSGVKADDIFDIFQC